MAEKKKNSTKTKKQLKKSYVYDTLTALTLLLVAIIMFFGLFSGSLGLIGSVLKKILLGVFGIGGILVPIAFIFTAFILIMKKKNASLKFGLAMLFIILLS